MRLALFFLMLALPCFGQVNFVLTPPTNYVTQPKYDDSQVPAFSVKVGASAPTLGNFGPSGNLQIYLFQADSVDDQVFFTVQLPHSWKTSSASIYPHVHWCRTADPGSAALTNVVWGLEYSWASITNTFQAPTTIRATNSVAASNWVHQVTALPAIASGGNAVSSIIVARLFREGTSGSDNYDQNAAFLSFDIHLLKDGIGSSTEY